ncbi:MAG: porin family protein [Spirochaetaceae bacterium]|jgi:hypothetical protein|nr:porin family protein [Spirochaetaceae bacterium]
MAQKSFLKTAAFLVLLAGISASGAFAQITVSGGFALSKMDAKSSGQSVEGDIGVGGNIYLDYLLPINIPLSLGGEIGVDSSSITEGGATDNVLAIPILLRAAYHFDLNPKLDLYLVGKIGYTLGFITSGPSKEYLESAGGLAIGFDVGVAYYFTSFIGVFAEGGFDDYMVKSKFSFSGGYSWTIDTPFYRFITLGISIKK